MSNDSIHIDVEHITRVEGHGNIHVDIENGTIDKVEWQVPEAPRFFEAMVVGRDHQELASITSRICGICSIGHTFASLKASEAAMGIEISEQTSRLRKILNLGENLQSHVLHVCYLVVPDLLKVNSVIPLIETHTEVILIVTKLHRLANELCDIIGGRTTHPIRAKINGWSKLPKPKELEALKKRLVESVDDLKKIAEVVKSLAGGLPNFVRETEYISLTDPNEYALYDGKIKSSDLADPIAVSDYEKVTNEFLTAQSTAKWAKFNRESYFAGALARYNNNYKQLTELSLAVGKDLGLDGPNYNPYMNNIAQVVEAVNSVGKLIEHIDWCLDKGLKEEDLSFKIKEGRGVGAVDVPRGILFHDYTYDKNGKCVKANCIIPTNQNHNNIQKDMEKLVPSKYNKTNTVIPSLCWKCLLELMIHVFHVLRIFLMYTLSNKNIKPVIIGIGNTLMGDDGAGPFVISLLINNNKINAEILTLDTPGHSLLTYICNKEYVIIIDAIKDNSEPGTVKRFLREDVISRKTSGVCIHDADIFQVIDYAKKLGIAPDKVIFYGITAERIAPIDKLSVPVKKGCEKAAMLINKEMKDIKCMNIQ